MTQGLVSRNLMVVSQPTSVGFNVLKSARVCLCNSISRIKVKSHVINLVMQKTIRTKKTKQENSLRQWIGKL